jgi:hypothetical protein
MISYQEGWSNLNTQDYLQTLIPFKILPHIYLLTIPFPAAASSS